MILKRHFFIVFLALVLLLRSASGFAMQIDMVYGMTHSSPMTSQVMPTCHEAMQGTSATDSYSANESSACSLCCIAAAIPQTIVFVFSSFQHSAPTAVLFKSLPVQAQRPTKPPLV